jgi:branched-chain amino acid transport system permease protein
MSPEFASDAATPPKWWWWIAVALTGVAMFLAPYYVDISLQLDLAIIFVFALLALSMGFLWSYAGILSFGQTIFFGLGGYSYAILALNTGTTGWPFVAAVLLPVFFSALLGYFMIYGRISDIYLSVVTLVVTLIFEKSIRSTSGPEYVIGQVRLNGQNGIPGIPGLSLPGTDGAPLAIEGVFYLCGGLMLIVYISLRLLLLTKFGRVLVGIRENERRMELLGYDTRRYKLGSFMVAGGVASLSGVLYAVWGNFVAPEMFNLNQAAQVVIWVIVGGRSTLIGPVVGTALVQYFSNWLGTVNAGQVTVALGLVLMVFVLLFPRGLLPTIGDGVSALLRRIGKRKMAASELSPASAERT